MSNSLRNAADSTVHMLSDLVDTARDHIEDLPLHLPLHNKRSRRPLLWWAIGFGAIGAALVVVNARRRRLNAAEAMVDVTSPGF